MDKLQASRAATRFDPSASAKLDASIETRTAEMKQLGREALGLDPASKDDEKQKP